MLMRSWIRNLFARPATRTIRNAPRRTRLRIEALEDGAGCAVPDRRLPRRGGRLSTVKVRGWDGTRPLSKTA